MTKKNIFIRTDFVVYNTKKIYDENIVKIPSYVIQDIIEFNKSILIKLNDRNIVLYTTNELKKNLKTVEAKVYSGRFRNEDVKYNLALIEVDKNKLK